jgi:hypothetical protein
MTTSTVLISSFGLCFLSTSTRSIASSVVSCPSITLPKIVYLLSRCACFEYVMKNWDLRSVIILCQLETYDVPVKHCITHLFVLGPEFAIATTPR